MPSTNKTPVLSLNQWVPGDYPHFDDHNADNALLDAAQAANAAQFADIGTQLDNKASINNVHSWTPTIAGYTTPGMYTYQDQHGYCLQMGNIVYFAGFLRISGVSTAGTGYATIIGLPGSIIADGIAMGSVVVHNLSYFMPSGVSQVGSRFLNVSGTPRILFDTSSVGSVSNNITTNVIQTNTAINFSGWYVIEI